MKLLKLKTHTFFFLILPLQFILFNSEMFCQTVKLSEVMFRPIGKNNEYIELFNTSKTEPVDLNGFKILYHTSASADSIVSPDSSYILQPEQYAIILEGDYDFENAFYNIPSSALVFTIDDNAFGRSGLANTSNRTIYLINADNDTLESYTYTANNEEGFSDERVFYDNDIWENSKIENGTPGKINSVSQKTYNVKITNVLTTPPFPLITDTVKFTVCVKNTGKEKFNFVMALYNDENSDSLADKLLETSAELSVTAKDSLYHTFEFIDTVHKQKQNYIFTIKTPDDDTTDNKYFFTLSRGFLTSSIIINEIMFLPQNDEPEWIELYNNSKYNIDISDWQIGDVFTKPVFKKITKENFIFNSKSFLVISKSKEISNYYNDIPAPVIELKFANLNNDIDGIVLKDNRSITIDSILYTKDFQRINGHSIERINTNFASNNANNWKPAISIENATPGRINSVTPKNYDLILTSIATVPNNPVKNSKIKIEAKILNGGNFNAENFSLNFYYRNLNNHTPLETYNNLSLSKNDSLVIVSVKKINIKDTLVIGAIIEFDKDEDKTNNLLQKRIFAGFNKNTVLINEIMINPANNEPQWIEFINNTDSTININGWNIGDSKDKNIIAGNDILIPPKNFFLVSNYFQQNIFPNDVTVIQTNLPYLNKQSDEVIIYDFRNATIDSMTYKMKNGIPSGISLERIDLNIASSKKNNWLFSLSKTGSTPGKENSTSNLPGNNFGEIIFNEIMYKPDTVNSEFVELYNNTQTPIELGGWRIEDNDGKYFYVSKTSKTLYPGNYFVVAADSSIYNNYTWLNNFENISITNSKSLLLSNSGKLIYLKDFRNKIIDSLYYKDTWQNPNILNTQNVSIELINPELKRTFRNNWSSSVSKYGATPGKRNSIYLIKEKTKSELNISPNPFSPDNDGFEDFTSITYKLKQTLSQIRIKIYDSKGRLCRTLVNNTPSGSEGTIIFNGLNDNGIPLKTGIYILFLEAIDTQNNIAETLKAAMVIGKKF